MTTIDDGRRRVAIEAITPQVDCGIFAVKRVVGDHLVVEADVFADGHDHLAVSLLWRRGPGGSPASAQNATQSVEAMKSLGNDRWRASFLLEEMGRYRYQIRGIIDAFSTWQHKLDALVDAGQDISVELLIGTSLIEATTRRASGQDAGSLAWWARRLQEVAAHDGAPAAARAAFDEELVALMTAYPDTSLQSLSPELAVVVDRPLARFGAWYEVFPRSAAPRSASNGQAGKPRHGTFADLERRLPHIAQMGFDIVYLPPVHPIGVTHRKGRNNAATAAPEDPGSPWAIGGAEGGHTAIHPQLGTLEDFDHLVGAAARFGMEVALDFAIQCSPDHPWVREHPEWFRRRPDGTLQYAENPPKRYEDIYPVDFESEDWEELWDALREVVEFWIGHGVKVFRVDNPHTKALGFWEWLIGEITLEHPEVIFLAEAFTRPKVMYRLAKAGFTQSYTYFTWRTSKEELTEYLNELSAPEVSDFFRPNFWPNTPDILAQQLQAGGRPSFIARLVLAATLAGNYGIYGPAYELGENTPLTPGTEDYRDSEKYEIRSWDVDRMDSLSEIIASVNRARHLHPALQGGAAPRFHAIDNGALIAYSKVTADTQDAIVVVVNLDPWVAQSGWLDLGDLASFGLPAGEPYTVEDLLTASRFTWKGPRSYIRLDPATMPAHILAIRPERPRPATPGAAGPGRA